MRALQIPFILLIFSLLAAATNVYAQEELDGYDSIADRVLLKKELTGGIVVHNLGMGVNFRKGVNKTFFNSRIFEMELVNMKHPKQVRMVTNYAYAKGFFYGKLNHVYMLRAGYGFKKLLNRKPYWGGIELRAVYLGGFSLAISKPVYLYFWYENDPYHYYMQRYDPDNTKHSLDLIYGRAPFLNGFDEIKVYPGIYARGGLNFEFGTLNSKIRSLEVGGVVEYFPIPIPIMASNPENSFFLTFYLNFSLGKRYN